MDGLTPEQLEILAKDSQGPLVMSIVIAFTVLSLVCVFLRFFTRIKFTRLVGTEDYLTALSMLFAIAASVCQLKQVQWGAGKHQVFTDLSSLTNSLKYLYWTLLNNVVSLTLVKVSICMQYRRIFGVTETRLSIYIVLGICVATGLEAFLTFAFACIPVDAFWDITKVANARCLDSFALTLTNGSLNIVTDLMVAALPVRAIWRLQLVRKQKIALIAIMTVGWSVCIISCLRLHSLVVLSQHEEDTAYYFGPPIYWASIEMNLAIICACVPTLKPLLIQIVPDFTPRRSGNNTTSHPTVNSRWSVIGRSFKKLDGSDGSDATPAHLMGDSAGTELEPVTSLLPVHRQDSSDPRRIRVTHEIQQQSNHLSLVMEDSEIDEVYNKK